ncbi:hypothetical protein EVAR_84812_1 [Eumeta japonica]|uniref:Uncharacterized protein n=1 Tax=Eumeta variegata TaxID=151549 RepID=A0A4C1U844_EUMVA|nr:hypothetical protein EVAR_84812_1 [Eumeta japonica]
MPDPRYALLELYHLLQSIPEERSMGGSRGCGRGTPEGRWSRDNRRGTKGGSAPTSCETSEQRRRRDDAGLDGFVARRG